MTLCKQGKPLGTIGALDEENAHTEAERGAEYFTPDAAKHQPASIVDTIDLGMADLEGAHHVARPCYDGPYCNQADDTWYDTQCVEYGGNGQNAEAYGSLGHEAGGTNPS